MGFVKSHATRDERCWGATGKDRLLAHALVILVKRRGSSLSGLPEAWGFLILTFLALRASFLWDRTPTTEPLPCPSLGRSRQGSSPEPYPSLSRGWSVSPTPFLLLSILNQLFSFVSVLIRIWLALYSVSPGPAPTENHVSWAGHLSDHSTQWPVCPGRNHREHLPVGGENLFVTRMYYLGMQESKMSWCPG